MYIIIGENTRRWQKWNIFFLALKHNLDCSMFKESFHPKLNFFIWILLLLLRLQVAMMSGQLEIPVGYSEKLAARLLELPLLNRYSLLYIYYHRTFPLQNDLLTLLNNRRMSMFLILPDQVHPGVASLELNINTTLVKELMGTLKVYLFIYSFRPI